MVNVFRIHWAIERCADSLVRFDVFIFFVVFFSCWKQFTSCKYTFLTPTCLPDLKNFKLQITSTNQQKYAKSIGFSPTNLDPPPLTKPPEKTSPPKPGRNSPPRCWSHLTSNQSPLPEKRGWSNRRDPRRWEMVKRSGHKIRETTKFKQFTNYILLHT